MPMPTKNTQTRSLRRPTKRSWRDIAKEHIRKHEGFNLKPKEDGKDSKTGRTWYSVGYGSNTSGFWDLYPDGIENHYKNGITKQQAEKLLDHSVKKLEAWLSKFYGSRWNQFNDNQKAAIMDVAYLSPATVIGKKSLFYNAVIKGDKNAGRFLSVKEVSTGRNSDRYSLYNLAVMPALTQSASDALDDLMRGITTMNTDAVRSNKPAILPVPRVDVRPDYTNRTPVAPPPLLDINQSDNNMYNIMKRHVENRRHNDSVMQQMQNALYNSTPQFQFQPAFSEPIQPPYVSQPSYAHGKNAFLFWNRFGNTMSLRRYDEGKDRDGYYEYMEKVAKDNYKLWRFPNEEAALLHALNDNAYNYRAFYNKYGDDGSNAATHWTDEFKTVYHPTFSEESIYSGKKSQYNPKGIKGGYWINGLFVPSVLLMIQK